MGARRVAVTGIGAISALGNNLEDFYRSLAAAHTGVRRLPAEVAMGSGVQVGALADWDPAAHFKGPEAGALDRVTQFALTAAGQALAASCLDPAAADRNRIGATSPMNSWPGVLSLGCGRSYIPCRSLPQIALARIRSSTHPGRGAGRSFSTISNWQLPRQCTAFIASLPRL